MKDHGRWQELMAGLASVCHDLAEGLAAEIEGDAATRIAHALFRNGLETHRAVAVLYAESLPTQAQVLVRVLLEVRIDLEMFLRLTATDPQQAVRRIVDAMLMEKVRQQRQSEFRGHELVEGAPTPEQLLALEKDAIQRYGNSAKNIRQYGFSGLTVENRARELGLSDLYDVVYRNLSRNVHGTDYMEHLREQGIREESRWSDYEDLRDHVVLSTAITCLWQMAFLVNIQFGHRLDEALKEVWKECTSFEHWVPIPGSDRDPRVWEERRKSAVDHRGIPTPAPRP